MLTLAQRIETGGALSAKEAVGLLARVARTVETHHAAGKTHGKLSPYAIGLTGDRLSTACLRRSDDLASRPEYHSPQRGLDGAPSRDDDAYALALLLFFALTGHGPEMIESSGKFPPLAVFDAGDDDLDELLGSALSPALGSGFRDMSLLRRELDLWLESHAVQAEAGLPWEGEEAPAFERDLPIDLSSLPPPPEAETPTITVEPVEPDPEGDRETIPGAPKSNPTSPITNRPPRLVPPKALRDRQSRSDRPPPRFEDEPTASPPGPTASAPPSAQGEQKRGARRMFLMVAGAALIVGAGALLLRMQDERAVGPSSGSSASSTGATVGSSAPKASTTAQASSATPPSATADTSVSPSPSAVGSSQPTASAQPIAPREAPKVDANACIASALAPDTFASAPKDLEFVCEERDVVKGAARLRTRIVVAGDGRAVTDGMKEWALLGFYELAAYATIRMKCCPWSMPSTAPEAPEICTPTVLAGVNGVAAALGKPEAEVTKAITELDKAIRCVARAHQSDRFGGHPKPSGGEGTALKRVMTRLSP